MSTDTATRVDYTILDCEPQTTRERWNLQTISIFSEYGIDFDELQYFYSCLSYYYLPVPKTFQQNLFYSLKRKLTSFSDHDVTSQLIAINKPLINIQRQLKQYESIKQYIFAKTNDNTHFWLIFLREKYKEDICYNPLVGSGQTLPEADLDFTKNRIKLFDENLLTVAKLLSLNIPVTQEEMLALCYKFDNEVDPLSVEYAVLGKTSSFMEGDELKLKCKSKNRIFSLTITCRDVYWIITRYIPVEHQLFDCLPINTSTENTTLEKAFEALELKYQQIISDPKLLEEIVDKAVQREIEELNRLEGIDGERHFNQLLEEEGEDVFSDRD